MKWPNQVPYFTEDDIHNEEWGEYDIKKNGVMTRCAMGWLKHLFLDFGQYGPLDTSNLEEAELILRRLGKISRYDIVEEWNDRQTLAKIADILNKTMAELGYEISETDEIDED